ncbi:iron-containing alcohol dehydrogenase [Lampropedia puyangensis]|uniref:Iron-containing alcohol dehydrogenase n=1 Tax=Lampropedia puyangensis TaxID=1330072 RepID=A0A4S8F2K6_9BURK|nr:iron-containing alcohol dehydrogenase [Lampropedia puyangensis]THU01540.1 iron-containing alcohol dehydrogenase [Lampropedia puyangensis]
MHIHSTVLSGAHVLDDVAYLLEGHRRAVFVSDRNIMAIAQVQALLQQVRRVIAHVQVVDSVPPEPSDADVRSILQSHPLDGVDLVIGVGGGSVLDVAKLLSALAAPQSPSLDALLAGEKITERVTALMVPTTAGTGSEATPNAILAIPERQTKVGIISPVMLPDYVVLAPELTTSMPQRIAASTGVDALCHLIECFTSTIANPVCDNYAMIGMQKLFGSIEASVEQPHNVQAKLQMLWASYYGGACIAHAGTHLVHAMSYPLGGRYHIAHGVANAILLAPCFAFVRPLAVQKLALAYELVPGAQTGLSDEAKSQALVDYFKTLVRRLNLPTSLPELGIAPDNLPTLVQGALDVQRLIKNVPGAVTAADIEQVYRQLF